MRLNRQVRHQQPTPPKFRTIPSKIISAQTIKPDDDDDGNDSDTSYEEYEGKITRNFIFRLLTDHAVFSMDITLEDIDWGELDDNIRRLKSGARGDYDLVIGPISINSPYVDFRNKHNNIIFHVAIEDIDKAVFNIHKNIKNDI